MLAPVQQQRSSRAFHALLVSRSVSAVGDALSLVALMLYVAETSGQAVAVALLLLVGDFAPSLFAPLAGAVGDRFDLRRVMIGCDLVQAALVAGLTWLMPPLPVLLVLVGLRSVTGQIFAPASRAALPQVVADAELGRANAALGLGGNLGEVAGPLLAALLIPLIGIRGTLAVDAATFVLSALALTRLPRLPRGGLGVESLLTAARSGLAATWALRPVRVIVVGFAAVVACNGLDDVALIFLVRDDLSGSDSATALVLAGVGAGLLVGNAVIARLRPSRSMALLFVSGLVLSSAGNVLTGLAGAVVAAALLQALRGVGAAAMDVGSATLLQRMVPPDLRARVFGNLYGLIGVAAAGSYVVGGLLVDRIGPRPA